MTRPFDKVEMHDDGSATVYLNPDYLGSCVKCHAEATHGEWVKFEKNEAQRKAEEHIREVMPDFPPIEGVWHYVCDACCDPTVPHET